MYCFHTEGVSMFRLMGFVLLGVHGRPFYLVCLDVFILVEELLSANGVVH